MALVAFRAGISTCLEAAMVVKKIHLVWDALTFSFLSMLSMWQTLHSPVWRQGDQCFVHRAPLESRSLSRGIRVLKT